jgi:hypothetical protein
MCTNPTRAGTYQPEEGGALLGGGAVLLNDERLLEHLPARLLMACNPHLCGSQPHSCSRAPHPLVVPHVDARKVDRRQREIGEEVGAFVRCVERVVAQPRCVAGSGLVVAWHRWQWLNRLDDEHDVVNLSIDLSLI